MMSTRSTIGTAASGAAVGGAFGGPVGAGIGAGVGGLVGLSGLLEDDSAQKALLAKQKQMAAEAQARREQLQRAHLRSMNQQMMAFGPRNQVMAQMFGPEAAFTGKQMADMTANPMGAPQADPLTMQMSDQWAGKGLNTAREIADYERAQREQNRNKASTGDLNRQNDRIKQVMEYRQQVAAYEREEAARRAQMEAAFGTPQGPAPIAPTQAAPTRRY